MRDSARGGALTEVTFYILLALHQPRHGYAVMQFIEEKTGGRLALGAGTLYGALNTLQEKGWIAPWGADGGRKKEFAVTDLGRAAAARELVRLKELAGTAEEIMGGERDGKAVSLFLEPAGGPGQMAEQNGGPGPEVGGDGKAAVLV